MNVFERLQQRFSKMTTVNRSSEVLPSSNFNNEITSNNNNIALNKDVCFTKTMNNKDMDCVKNSTIVEQPPSSSDYIVASSDKSDILTISNQDWETSTNSPLTKYYTQKIKNLVKKSKSVHNINALSNLYQNKHNLTNNLNVPSNRKINRAKKTKTPASSFYRVSSDEESEDEESDEDGSDDSDDENYQTDENKKIRDSDSSIIEPNDKNAFGRQSQRVRKSINRAKAALPTDFVDRIGGTTSNY